MSEGSKDFGRRARPPDLNRLRTDLEAYMTRKGLRSTEQRRVIIDTFFDKGEHLTVDELLELVRAQDPRVGYATVYRTLKMLADSGIVVEHRFGDGYTRFELADEDAHHDHLICLTCGKITEFEAPAIEELQDKIAARYGFQVLEHKHELYGTCKECLDKRSTGERKVKTAR
ncbi:MAG: Fur family transcriptional regulator [Polyangiaceae bacterium]